jgi:hypothetical protein
MVNIDTVYQRVLAFANKEQRGYITPQEFNLFANQAQIEIYEQYYYDLNKSSQVTRSDYDFASDDGMLEAKMQIFESVDSASSVASYQTPTGTGNELSRILPSYIYRVQRVVSNQAACEMLNTAEFDSVTLGGPLTYPTSKRPVANIRGNILRVLANGPALPSSVYYFKKPNPVSWGYFVLSGKALYDPSPNKTSNFQLHQSEETELVYKILKYAGVAMKRDDIAKAGQGLEVLQQQQEKQ